MGYELNGVNTEGIPMYLINHLIHYAEINTLVELGTAGGDSTRVAAKHFKKVITIELIENRAVVDETIKNVTWLTGHTVDLLPKIIDDLIAEKNKIPIFDKDIPVYNYAMFFIDSHYSDPEPNTSEFSECPLLEELDAIARYQADAIIIIDDARLFLGQPPAPLNPTEWPSIQEIFIKLKNLYPHNYSTIVDDYIISLPERLREPIDAEWRGRFNIRYPNAADKLKSEVKNVYSALQNYLK